MKYSKWEITGYDRKEAAKWFRGGTSPLSALFLVSRGIKDSEGLESLIDNSVSSLEDPFLLNGMSAAVDRISAAIEKGEKIGVFGDYDVDGITATCLLTRYFRSKGAPCINYIPERIEDGYGLQKKGIEALRCDGAELIVSVDCGITAHEAANYARDSGLDLIITDHHVVGDRLPPAVAVVNPKRTDQTYPNRYLSGVGVAFKLACALEGADRTEEMLETYGDFVAAGTISDVMPLIGENRILVRHGLEMLRRGGHVGFEKLGQRAGVDMRTLGTYGMSFGLAPRINAAGRLGKTALAKDLLMTDDAQEANWLASQLCELNYERQRVEGEMMAQAEDMMKSYPDNAPIVLAGEKWHQGVAGVVASRIMERYSRPTVIITIQDGIAHGSCRSSGSFSIYDALKACEDTMISFGGHKFAAGIVLKEEDVPRLRSALTEYYRTVYSGDEEEQTVLSIDFEVVKPEIITLENIDALKEFEPFGNGNPAPKMCIMGAGIDMITAMGHGKHTKLWAVKNGCVFECLMFNSVPEQLGVKAGDVVDLAFEPKISEFRGRRSIQLQLADICLHGEGVIEQRRTE